MVGILIIASMFGFSSFGFEDFGVSKNVTTGSTHSYYVPSGSDHYVEAGGALYQVRD
jgi:hypothetical protein